MKDCFKAKNDNNHYGLIPFLRWGANVDKIELYWEALEAWQRVVVDLKEEWATGLEAQNVLVDFPWRQCSPQIRYSGERNARWQE